MHKANLLNYPSVCIVSRIDGYTYDARRVQQPRDDYSRGKADITNKRRVSEVGRAG
jgi:hypothetical protein